MVPLHPESMRVRGELVSLRPFPVNHKHVLMQLLQDRYKLHSTAVRFPTLGKRR